MNKLKKSLANKGMALAEVLVAAFLLSGAFAGTIAFISQYLRGLEHSQNMTLAINAAQQRIESILGRVNPTAPDTVEDFFSDTISDYTNNPTFNVYDSTGSAMPNFKGTTYISSQNINDLTFYRIKAVVCWEQAGGILIGEDKNLNGVLDSGEDKAGGTANELDSPVSIIINITNID
ncbi:MAG: hypothetical protein MUF05_00425 [Candidatus Omnitrophica bacterium]|jgi:Tfp pilus assembly protein PilV|nr:hypothetical protein [Candidatus Omnitrophota bacterium]